MATPTATATASPTATATATATATVTITPTPTPTPATEVTFDFEFDEEGWVYMSPTTFNQPVSSVANSQLRITTSDNTNSFGFWESPMFEIVSGDSPKRGANTVVIGGSTGPESLFQTTWTVSSTVKQSPLVPTVRVRSSSADFQQSDVMVATSTQDGLFSPTTTERTYTQHFSQPTGQSMFRLDFDVLNFDPLDAANATVGMDRVVVSSMGTVDLTGESEVLNFSFANQATNGFTQRLGAPLAAPAFEATTRGLLIRGTNGSRGVLQPTTFGFWGYETGVAFQGNRLNRVEFTMSTEATSAQASDVAAFRMRVNDSSLNFSAYVNIESMNTNSRIPVDGATETYYLYFVTPAEIAGNTWIFAFDYLHVPEMGNDPAIGVVMENLRVVTFDVPVN